MSAGAHRLAALRREWPLLVALGCLVAALTLPPIDLSRPAHHYQIVFDVSQSMAVRDVLVGEEPASRLEFARAAAETLLRELPCGARVGWSAFVERRTVTLVTPLETCEHYDALLAALGGIDARMRWGEASGIGKGLHQALRAADSIGDGTFGASRNGAPGSGVSSGVAAGDDMPVAAVPAAAIMLTDGQEAPPLGPGQSGFPKDEGLGVRGLLGGIGGDAAVPIPKLDAEGRTIGYWTAEEVVQREDVPAARSHEELSRLDEAHLRDLARLASLEYVRLVEPGTLAEALRRSGLGRSARAPSDVRWLPAALALALLGWRFRPDNLRRGRWAER